MSATRSRRRPSRPAESPIPMTGTGDGPRPDPTTFTRRATDRFDDTNE
ncbi:hypothetical protein [Halorubrum laminariae]|uniref:Uncharacterized protein n=1 Tax=Halorubrum laminariae TaxID=1433523 RepID=A0ABD6BYK0_9EURY|nr:hypothetical protein [Halorubrum laminariae]